MSILRIIFTILFNIYFFSTQPNIIGIIAIVVFDIWMIAECINSWSDKHQYDDIAPSQPEQKEEKHFIDYM